MSLGTQSHMDDGQVERYSMGDMTEEESARCEEHLLLCESCQERVTNTDTYVSAMSRAAAEVRRQPQEREWRSLLLARLAPLAAVVAFLLVLVTIGVRYASRGPVLPAVTVNLEAHRGAAVVARTPPGHRIRLGLDLTGIPAQPAYRVAVVDGAGRIVWNGEAQPRDGRANSTLPAMNAGVYFVRLYGSSAELLREYGLEVAGR